MSLDGRFLIFLADELRGKLTSGRIQKISQLSKTDFLFAIRANNQNHKLYISLSTSLSRVNLTEQNFPSDYLPGGFCMFLRKHLECAIIDEIQALNYDRILQIDVEGKNDIGDLVKLKVIIEMFSRYTNLIITDSELKVINSFKHVSPFDGADRTIVNGVQYELPEDKRLSPDDLAGIQSFFQTEKTHKDIIAGIRGISPLFAMYIAKTANYKPQQMYEVYKNLLEAEVKPTMVISDKNDYYYIDIFKQDQKYFSTLSELLDNYYLDASSVERVKQIYKYLNGFCKRELKRKKNKLEKLSVDLENALNSDVLRIKGDTLIANQHHIKRGDAAYIAYAYELDQDLEIELDRLLNPIQNANKYYNKYKKQKVAVKHINEQIRITKSEIIYFDELMLQIQDTSALSDLLEIQDDLIDNGFLPRKKRDKSKKKPNFDTYKDELGILIYVGKNNIQNNYLSHKFAKKDYWWFHVKQQTGSHVIVCSTDELQEKTIRMAANLAALHSRSRQSSSVAVDYTRVRNIKKVPGMIGSFVTYTNQRTIYIDPDQELLN